MKYSYSFNFTSSFSLKTYLCLYFKCYFIFIAILNFVTILLNLYQKFNNSTISSFQVSNVQFLTLRKANMRLNGYSK